MFSIRLNKAAMNGKTTPDYNGNLMPKIDEFINNLKPRFKEIYLLSADTYGFAAKIALDLGIKFQQLPSDQDEAEAKADFLAHLGSKNVLAIGNGNNDHLMLKHAALGIGIIGPEGAAFSALANADLIFNSIEDAFQSLLYPKAIIASLRR
jgi:P-type E1-E2 ATPase